MLTRKDPLKLNALKPLLALPISFTLRLMSGYALVSTSFPQKELIFLLSASPRLPDGLGGVTAVNLQNFLTNVQGPSLDVVNHVVNHILLRESHGFTYQDKVYITSLLRKAGITDVRNFMDMVHLNLAEYKRVLRQLALYQREKPQLASSLPEGRGDATVPHAPGGGETVDPSLARSSLHSAIYRRLEAGDLYAVFNAYSQNQTAVSPLPEKRSHSTLQQLWEDKLLCPGKLWSETHRIAHNLTLWSAKHYERGGVALPPTRNTEVFSQAAPTPLFAPEGRRTTVHALSRRFLSGGTWREPGGIIGGTRENNLSRFEMFYRGESAFFHVDRSRSSLQLRAYEKETDFLFQHRVFHEIRERELRREHGPTDDPAFTRSERTVLTRRRDVFWDTAAWLEVERPIHPAQGIAAMRQALPYIAVSPPFPSPQAGLASTPGADWAHFVRTPTPIKLKSIRFSQLILARREYLSVRAQPGHARAGLLLPGHMGDFSAPGSVTGLASDTGDLPHRARLPLTRPVFTGPAAEETLTGKSGVRPYLEPDERLSEERGYRAEQGKPFFEGQQLRRRIGIQPGTVQDIPAAPGIVKKSARPLHSEAGLWAEAVSGVSTDSEGGRDAPAALRGGLLHLHQTLRFVGISPSGPEGTQTLPGIRIGDVPRNMERRSPLSLREERAGESWGTLLSRALQELDRRNRAAQARVNESLGSASVPVSSVPDAARTISEGLRALHAPEKILRELTAGSGSVRERRKLSKETQALLRHADAATRTVLEAAIRRERGGEGQENSSILAPAGIGALNAESARLERETVELTRRLGRELRLAEREQSNAVAGLNRPREIPVQGVAGVAVQEAERRPLRFIHRRERGAGIQTKTLLERLEQRQTAALQEGTADQITRREIFETQSTDQTHQIAAQSGDDITALIDRTLSQQLSAISEKVYQQMEKRLQTERFRRGRL